MLQHDRQHQIFLVVQMPRQQVLEALEVGQETGSLFAPRRFVPGLNGRIGALGKAVDQVVQRMVVGVQHLEPACDAEFQPGKLREIGVVSG